MTYTESAETQEIAVEIAARNHKVADGTVIARYAAITMDEFVTLVEGNPDIHFKFNAAGDVISMSPMNIHAIVQSLIATHFNIWLFTGALPGYGAPTDGAFELEGWRSRPDVAICPHVGKAIPREAPLVAVEVRSDSNPWHELRAKAARYLAHGTQMVWLVDTDERRVEVHRVGEQPQRLTGGDLIEGGDTLPGFRVAVSALFPAAT